jgi:hypothetical protein
VKEPSCQTPIDGVRENRIIDKTKDAKIHLNFDDFSGIQPKIPKQRRFSCATSITIYMSMGLFKH